MNSLGTALLSSLPYKKGSTAFALTIAPSIKSLSLADIPLKMSSKHLSNARAARFGARWTCAKDSINFA